MPDWRLSSPLIVFAGLFLTLIFPAVGGIPVAGYLVEIAAMFFIVYYSFSGRYLFLGAATVGSILISAVVFGPSLILIALWAKVIVSGTLYGKMLAAGVKPTRSFVAASVVIALIVLTFFWMEKELIYSEIDRFESLAASTLPPGETAPGTDDGMAHWLGQMVSLFKRLLPTLLILSAMTQFFVAIVLLHIALRAGGVFMPHFVDFVFWKMPFHFIYPVGAVIILRLVGTDNIKIFADNALLLLGVLYAVFGFSAMEYYLRKVRLSLFLRVLFYMGFLFLQVPGLILAAAVGIFDSYFDFRHVRARLIG
mgnify:CR=1 FL=1